MFVAKKSLSLALPKGKLLVDSVELLERAGIACREVLADERQLTFELPGHQMRIIVCRPTDIPTFVEYGAADLGFVGKDTIVEQAMDVAELVDLKFGYCRFVVAMPEETLPPRLQDGSFELRDLDRKRVATKFPRVAEQFFSAQGMQVTPIKLHGNIELAPKVGLAEMIVDIVSTGKTLKVNRLAEVAQIFEATSRLIANRVSYRLKHEDIQILAGLLRDVVAGER
ncbi:MAG: ATP phosphoribosyltransferase [Peptococcaceae bacterium]|nr:ATP phosphoribosyltransferase [Peptococcaceae bacterium]